VEQQDQSLEDWGEPGSERDRRTVTSGDWSFDLTGHGLESIRYRGTRVASRVFFSVRDLVWGSPRVTFRYSDGPPAVDGVAITGTMDNFPLEISGTAVVTNGELRLSFGVRALAEIDVSRAGPCILHERTDLAPRFVASGPDGRKAIDLAERILIERIATHFDALELTTDSLRLRIGFEGELFEMEDQRNWGDSTFKSYCPPLADPQPISLRAGEIREYDITFTATAIEDAGRPTRSAASGPIELHDGAGPHPMPRLGLLHSGGALSPDAAARLRELAPDYLHLLVGLASKSWRDDLVADLEAAAQLGVDAVITVDAVPTDDSVLAELSELARGRASTVLLFDRGKSTTSDQLAATRAFSGTGIRLGGGTRSNFASLNAVGRAPAELEVIAVPLAVASHDDDRRALTTSVDSFAAIIGDTRRITGDRELLVGPVGFRPTFDSWGPPESVRDPREDWLSTSRRDGSRFAGAWIVAAVGAIAACSVARVTIGTTGSVGSPAFDALRAMEALRGRPVWPIDGGERVRGLRSADDLVLGIMTDDNAMIDYRGRVLDLASPRVFHDSLSQPTTV
jgi:hypothetical protein